MKSKLMIQIGLISLTLVLIGCGQSNQGRQTIQTQPTGNNGNQTYNPGGGVTGGEIQVQGPNLQQAIQSLVEVNATPVTVGTIGQVQGSGVFLTVGAALSVPLQQAINSGAQLVGQSSSFLLRARDSWSGQIDPSTGQAINDISVRLDSTISGYQASGQIRPGGSFNLVFRDAYGQVMLDGTIQGQSVQGTVGFQNAGRQPVQIGQFSGSVCAVFRCQ